MVGREEGLVLCVVGREEELALHMMGKDEGVAAVGVGMLDKRYTHFHVRTMVEALANVTLTMLLCTFTTQGNVSQR